MINKEEILSLSLSKDEATRSLPREWAGSVHVKSEMP